MSPSRQVTSPMIGTTPFHHGSSGADFGTVNRDLRFDPESRHHSIRSACLLRAKRRQGGAAYLSSSSLRRKARSIAADRSFTANQQNASLAPFQEFVQGMSD